MLQNHDLDKVDIQICCRCIYDERVNGIEFDKNSICKYCWQFKYNRNNTTASLK